ncbi:MAG: phospho-N-acetylmuramoyl-pentapeptide-transferase [Saprospiraceae bacterium]|nr:phospho-N-acetylmuramoyl-pentapeptide-transferase [Saprospiraceae bacterium]
MLYYLFDFLERNFETPVASLFQFISFRAGLAIILSLIISMLLGGKIIRWLQRQQVGESVRDLGLKGQKEKEGTPTMGGIIILMAILIPCLLVAKLHNIYILLMLIATTWMGTIGFVDDYIKVFKKDKKGLSGKFKILGQVVLGLIVALTMLFSNDVVVQMPLEKAQARNFEIVKTVSSDQGVQNAYVKTSITNVPFLKDREFDYAGVFRFIGDNGQKFVWILFVPFVIFVVTAVSNAANLTDGLDGLATGVSAIMGVALGGLAYVSGNTLMADYLNILYLPGAGELVIFAACFLGACIGFLWYNSYPAEVFMGDTGSLALGSIIAVMGFLVRMEFLIPILCGVFLIENLSVVLQVAYFKRTKKKYGEGRRIFLMSPIHHHFQKKGMHESKIVIRFWIVAILLAVLTLITLKVR